MKKILAGTVAALCLGFGVSAQAQEAQSLDELLETVQQGRSAEAREWQQREAAFRAERSTQQQKLQQARNDVAREERTSEQLEAQFRANENTIAQKTETYQNRLANLNELFGVLQQVAGDTRANLQNSLISAEYPGRVDSIQELIDKTATGTTLPKIEEIRNLWSTILQEAIESGKTSVFVADVNEEGVTSSREVTRVGQFAIVSDGEFLSYNIETGQTEGSLSVLAAQPSSSIQSMARDLQNASGGHVDFAVDPLRGQLLALIGQSPSLGERINQGGEVGYVILGLGVIAILFTIFKVLSLLAVSGKIKRQMKSEQPMDNNPLGRVLQVYHDNRSVDVETLELKMDEAILKETPKLEAGNTFVKIVSVVAPLLGLFGTVTGMIVVFQSITLFGTGDPKLMAGGISQALVTTVLGLTVAIPTVLLHSFLAGRTRSLIHILEEQAAGIIAVHAEQENARA
ncbi:MAG: MotA/TolQ/ExbB proton channel family protein [Sphingomonadales bacterium]|jgi:biopolymer transport protein ExbB